MPLLPQQRRTLRKVFSKHYPTDADAQRVCSDIELDFSFEPDAQIITIWDGILKAADQANLIHELFKLATEEEIPLPEITPPMSRSVVFENEDDVLKTPDLFTNHLFIIGINEYQAGIKNLNNAVKDVQDFKEELFARYQFSEENCHCLCDQKATRNNIVNKLRELQTRLTEEDNLLIYFAGHGIMDKQTQTGYWIPADAKKGDFASYISNNEVRHYLQNLKTQHTLGIVDACFSGSMFLRSSPEVVQRYYNLPSRWLMTSGLKEPVDDGEPGTNSPFAKALLTQLRTNFAPALSINRLWDNMREAIVYMADQTPLCEPLPRSGHQGGEFFFLLKNATFEQIPTTANITVQTPRGQIGATSIDSLKSQLRNLVAADDLREAFAILNEKIDDQSSHKNLVIGRMGAYNGLLKRSNMGVISEDNRKVQTAQIRQAILYVVDELKERDLQN